MSEAKHIAEMVVGFPEKPDWHQSEWQYMWFEHIDYVRRLIENTK